MNKNLNPHAVALGRTARGHPKTLSPAGLEQRRNAAKARSAAAKARREAKKP